MNTIAKNGGWFVVGIGIGAIAAFLFMQQQSLNGTIANATGALSSLNSRLSTDESQVQSFLQTPVPGVSNPTAKQIAISSAMNPLGN